MRSRILAGCVASSQPATRAVPPLGASSVASMRSVVVLPAPFGPRKPKISPRVTERSTPATASTFRPRDLNTRRRPRVSITASASCPTIRHDSAGRGLLGVWWGARHQVPERLLRGSATRCPPYGADLAQDRRDRKSLQKAAGDVGGHRPVGERRTTPAGHGRRRGVFGGGPGGQ